MSEKNIFQRMAAVTAGLQTVAKNLNVTAGKGNSYKAVSERDVLDAVKPLETENGIYSYARSRSILESQMLESESEYNGKVTKKTTFFTRIETIYRFVNVDKPEEYVETTVFSEGIDTQDKGSGKAMTYADKYALMKAYKISTGDDPDQEASKETEYKRTPQEHLNHALCSDCGKPVTPFMLGGEEWSAKRIIEYSKLNHGMCLCARCIGKRERNAN